MKAQNFALKYREIRLLPDSYFRFGGFPVQRSRLLTVKTASTLLQARSILINRIQQNHAMTIGQSAQMSGSASAFPEPGQPVTSAPIRLQPWQTPEKSILWRKSVTPK